MATTTTITMAEAAEAANALGVVSKSKMCCINKYISALFGGAQRYDVICNCVCVVRVSCALYERTERNEVCEKSNETHGMRQTKLMWVVGREEGRG